MCKGDGGCACGGAKEDDYDELMACEARKVNAYASGDLSALGRSCPAPGRIEARALARSLGGPYAGAMVRALTGLGKGTVSERLGRLEAAAPAIEALGVYAREYRYWTDLERVNGKTRKPRVAPRQERSVAEGVSAGPSRSVPAYGRRSGSRWNAATSTGRPES